MFYSYFHLQNHQTNWTLLTTSTRTSKPCWSSGQFINNTSGPLSRNLLPLGGQKPRSAPTQELVETEKLVEGISEGQMVDEMSAEAVWWNFDLLAWLHTYICMYICFIVKKIKCRLWLVLCDWGAWGDACVYSFNLPLYMSPQPYW